MDIVIVIAFVIFCIGVVESVKLLKKGCISAKVIYKKTFKRKDN